MTPAELLDILNSFHQEAQDLASALEVHSRLVGSYDANNAYQQIVGRQDTHRRWLAAAIADLGGQPPPVVTEANEQSTAKVELSSLFEADAKAQQAFIDRWMPRVQTLSNARNRKLLQLILGETAEHGRVLLQALEGRTDMLGRHAKGKVTRGEVLHGRPRG